MTTAEPVHPHAHQPHARTRTPTAADAGSGSFAALIDGSPEGQACPGGRGIAIAANGAAQQAGTSHATTAEASALGKFIGHSTGTGQCVALVHATHPALGATAHWVRGAAVRGNTGLAPGTPIATFTASGRYANATDGSSHAAIYLGQTSHGVQVLDQWAGRPAAVRTIPWNNPGAAAANTGGAFHVVESRQARTA